MAPEGDAAKPGRRRKALARKPMEDEPTEEK
jgi:hypothetical protein